MALNRGCQHHNPVGGMNMKVKLERKLAEKYKKRSFDIRKGDTVKIVRGDFKGNEGKVNEVRDENLFIEKVTRKKAGGSMIPGKTDHSNVIITKLDLTDALRRGKLEAKEAKPKEAKEAKPKEAKEAKPKEAKEAKEAKPKEAKEAKPKEAKEAKSKENEEEEEGD